MHAQQGTVKTAAKILAGTAVVFVYAAGGGAPALAAQGAHTMHRVDSDRDGMPNRWEIRMGLNAHHANARGNPDRDGLRNLREYKLGTDPTDDDTDKE
jgi:hypothetical protein